MTYADEVFNPQSGRPKTFSKTGIQLEIGDVIVSVQGGLHKVVEIVNLGLEGAWMLYSTDTGFERTLTHSEALNTTYDVVNPDA